MSNNHGTSDGRASDDAAIAVLDQTTGARKPTPGIYRDVEFSEYLAWRCMSQSKLKRGRESMAHYKAAIESSSAPSDSMRLGRLFHAGALEPLTVPMLYCVMPSFELDEGNRTASGSVPKNPKATKYYREHVDLFVEMNRYKEVVTRDEYARLLGVVEAISRDAAARKYMQRGAESEVSFVWEDQSTGVLCKGRADCLDIGRGLCVDLKKHDSGRDFSNAIYRYGYHIQAAWYLDGLAALTGRDKWEYCIIAHTSEPPYICQAAPLDAAAVQVGRREYRTLLKQIQESESSGIWPGPVGPDCWKLPEWVPSASIVKHHGEEMEI